MQIVVYDLAKPTRLDRVLRDRFPEWGRQAVQQLITAKGVRVNGRSVWLASWLVRNGDRLEILQPPAAKPPPLATFDDRWLLAQEADLIVVNKPEGLLSEAPPLREAAANLLDLAKARLGDLILFHRLDRDTSGVVLLTRPGPINQYLDQAFKAGLVQKEYLAVVAKPNQLQTHGFIDAALDVHPQRRDRMQVVKRGGKRAITEYYIAEEAGMRQVIGLRPQTGRTHQLRVHLALLGAPILGDRLYGDPASAPRLLLHAHRLVLPALMGFPARSYFAPEPPEFRL